VPHLPPIRRPVVPSNQTAGRAVRAPTALFLNRRGQRAVNTVAVPHIADIQNTLSDALEPAALDVRVYPRRRQASPLTTCRDRAWIEKGCSYSGGRERRHGARAHGDLWWLSLKEAERYTRGAERKN